MVLMICDKTYELKRMYAEDESKMKEKTNETDTDTDSMGIHTPKSGVSEGVDIYLPPESGQLVEEITALCIEEIFDYSVTTDAARIIDNHKKRMIPRFR